MYDDDSDDYRNAPVFVYDDDDDFRNAGIPWMPPPAFPRTRTRPGQPASSRTRFVRRTREPPAPMPEPVQPPAPAALMYPQYPQYPQYRTPPFPLLGLPPGVPAPPWNPCGGTGMGLFGPTSMPKVLKTVGVAADLAGQAIAAIMPLPQPPTLEGKTEVDTENMKRYHEAVARHAKTDERIRTVAKSLREVLDLFRKY